MQIYRIFILTLIEAPFGAMIWEKWLLLYIHNIGLIIKLLRFWPKWVRFDFPWLIWVRIYWKNKYNLILMYSTPTVLHEFTINLVNSLRKSRKKLAQNQRTGALFFSHLKHDCQRKKMNSWHVRHPMGSCITRAHLKIKRGCKMHPQSIEPLTPCFSPQVPCQLSWFASWSSVHPSNI